MSHEINEKIITQLTRLAKLKLSPTEIEQYIPHIEKVLTHFAELEKLNTDAVEPLVTPVDIHIQLREDIAEQQNSSEDLIKLAPEKIGKLYKVPLMVGG